MMQEKIKTPLIPTRPLYLLAGFILVFTVGYMVGSVVPGQNVTLRSNFLSFMQ